MSAAPPPSGGVLERNLDAIRRVHADFIVPDSARLTEVDGVWRLQDGRGGVAIHSRDPQREADRIAAELLAEEPAGPVVVVGLGLGYLVDALERRGWAGKILAFEPLVDTVGPLLARRDLRAWLESDRLRILVGPSYAGAVDCWKWFGDGSVEPRVIATASIARLVPDVGERVDAILKRIRFDASANADARRQLAPRYLTNTLRNLAAIASQPDVSALAGAARKTPVVVVAAGPSLDQALEALRRVQNKALIIAVDTALRPLLAAGIQPHAVVAVDPSEANGRHLMDLPSCDDTFLVMEGSVDPFAVEAFTGRTYFFSVSDHQPWPWLQQLGVPTARLRAWGSVLTSAFDLAVTMDADPVVFVGADLSFTEGRPYCRGVSFEEDWSRAERWGRPLSQQWQDALSRWPAVMEPDVRGEPVATAAHLVAFRNWLVEQVKRDPTRRFINAGGAGILAGERIEQMSPSDMACMLDPYPPLPTHPLRERFATRDRSSVKTAVTRLVSLGIDGSDATIDAWLRFAPGLSIDALHAALSDAADAFTESGATEAVRDETAGERAAVPTWPDIEYLQQLAAAAPLVPFTIPPHRLLAGHAGARVFRFRTLAAAIILCAIRPQQDAVAEDGVPLARAYDLDHVVPGSYASCRDEVHFRASDDSDPRTNGRIYTILVPRPVAYLEDLPLQEALNHRV